MATTLASRSAARRWGAGTAAIARLLIGADSPLTGVAIAEAAGVSQPRASQVLKQFAANDGVRTTEHGYVGRPARLLELYRRRARPLLVQPERFWYATRAQIEQARRVLEVAVDRHAPIAFSADLAPDLLLP